MAKTTLSQRETQLIVNKVSNEISTQYSRKMALIISKDPLYQKAHKLNLAIKKIQSKERELLNKLNKKHKVSVYEDHLKVPTQRFYHPVSTSDIELSLINLGEGKSVETLIKELVTKFSK